MSYGLRMYTAHPGRLDEFVTEWREQVVPLRARSGFHVVGAWMRRDEDRFVWVLRYDGPGSYEEADARYYASPERSALSPDPSRHLASVQTWLLDAVPRAAGVAVTGGDAG